MKTLILAEKPSVARDIARVMGARQKGEGFLFGDQYIVTWAIGHLVALCDPEELDPKYKKWDAAALPILPEKMKTKVLPKTKAQFSVIKKLMADPEVDRIICATDSGREGELIFRYIYEQAGCKKPVDRLWISSMTDAAIKEGFQNLKSDTAYDALYRSARCRSEADWLVGMNASRAFTLRYNVLLSVGRVQTPTLNLLVQRDREIERFVPSDYWELRADFSGYSGLYVDEKGASRLESEEKARAIEAAVKGGTGRVVESAREKKRVPPPQLFDLTTLQREANRVMNAPAAKTLQAAQSLYEKYKLITYPRTDSRYLPHDMIPKAAQALKKLPAPYDGLARPVNELERLPVRSRVFDDKKISDHHAIVPTGKQAALDALPPAERRLYEIILRRFVAAFYPDYQYEAAKIMTQVNGHRFKSTGSIPIDLGWKALYQDSGRKKKAEGDDGPLPDVKVGDERKVKSTRVEQKQTKPPAPHNDASLLLSMENAGKELEDEALRESMKDSGLGTPATRAAIIERLIQVGYAKRSGKTILSTEKGRRLIAVAPPEITSPETTGKWEKALSDIAKSGDDARGMALSGRFMEGIRRYAAFLTQAALKADGSVAFEPEQRRRTKSGKSAVVKPLGLKCPACGQGELQENSKAFGCARWKEGCAFTIWKDCLERMGGPRLTAAMVKKLLSGARVQHPKGEIFFEEGRVKFRPLAGVKPPPAKGKKSAPGPSYPPDDAPPPSDEDIPGV